MGKSRKRKGGRRGKSACNKSLSWFSFAVAGGRKIPIGQSDNWKSRPPFNAFTWRPTWTCYPVKALADFNVVATRESTLKPEQEVALRALLDGKDVLAVLPTVYAKRLIYQIQGIKSIGYSAVDIRELTVSEVRQCNFKVITVCSSEKIKKKTLRIIIPHRYIKIFVMDVSLSLLEFRVLRIY